MKPTPAWAAAIVVAAAFAALPVLATTREPGPPPAPAADTPQARGEAIVTQSCSMCHAVGRTGNSPHPGAPPFRMLGEAYPVEDLEEALTEGIRTGHIEMPEFQFTDEEAADIVAYLQSIQAH